jgi:predicted RecB family nuclease
MKILSKSSFVRGMKCPKALYLHIFQPENRDETSESQQNIFNIGHNAGELAQQLFPGGIDASRGEPGEVQAALQYTRELIEQGQEVIYEAAFSDGETLCYMDILVKKDGLWAAYEVKASTQLKDYHIMDVSFQHYVITNSGLPLSGIYLVHINNQYIRRGELDLWQLFTFKDLTTIAENNRLQIAEQLLKLQQMIEAGIMPEIETGSHCDHPYPCDFAGSCHQDEPYFLLSDVKGIQGDKALALHNLGIRTFEDIPDDFPFTR